MHVREARTPANITCSTPPSSLPGNTLDEYTTNLSEQLRKAWEYTIQKKTTATKTTETTVRCEETHFQVRHRWLCLVTWPNQHQEQTQTKLKDEVEFWSCACIVKETVWNRPEKVDHLAYKNLCVLQGSGIIKMITNWPSLGKVTNTVHRNMYMGLHEHVA